MRSARASTMMSVVAVSVIANPFAVAQDSGPYIGANIGQSRAKIDDARITRNLLGVGFTGVSITDDNHDTGYKLFGGYQFNKYFALEGGYFDLGKFGFKSTVVPLGTLNGNIRVRGVNLDAVGTLPFTEKFSAFGRIGANYAEAKDSFTSTGAVTLLDPNPKKRATNLKFGAGLQYDFTKSVGMRAEAERYRISDAVGNKGDIDLVSVGVLIRFGRTTPAPAPVQQAETPPPPERVIVESPVLVVVPVVAKTQEYCTILDIQFEINEEAMQREEKEKLAVIGTFLTKYPETTVVIEGHTDNVGTPEHNLQLSQRRAESVVTYLVDVIHIDRSRLTAVGYGDTRPVAENGTEEGKRQNRRIDAVVACVTDIEGLFVKPARVTMAMMIEFDQNKAEIDPKYDNELRKLAEFLKANPSVTATVEGHTGNLQATPALAMEISQRRAQNVVNYLVDNFGIARSRLSAEGFGKARRFAYNTSAEGQQENRRVNVIINYPR